MIETGQKRSYPIDGPLDLRRTLAPLWRGRGDPTMRVGADGVWRATRTPDGPATIRLAVGGGQLIARAWGDGAGWALDHAPAMAGLLDDPAQLDALAAGHPLVRELARHHPGLRFPRTLAVMEALVPAIIEQKVTGDEAHRAWRGLVTTHGEPAPGPAGGVGLRVPPDPAVLAALPYFAFHGFGLERRRADAIRHVAARAGWLEAASDLGREVGQARLRSLPGVGPWTAAEVAARAWGDPDAVSVGDYHLPNLVAWVLAREPRGTDARMLELLEPFRGQRGRVIRLIEVFGVRAERHGPRYAGRRIERI
jgi:3-methyladenine DNA glycosylase/8-oxoguanine DNA glycosylase